MVGGKIPARLNLIEERMVWIQLLSEEVEEVLLLAFDLASSPFSALERWMESMGRPPSISRFRFRGVPLHAWNLTTSASPDCIGIG